MFRKIFFFLLIVFSFSSNAQDWAPVKGDLMTRWTKDVNPDNAWRQYPRPQMKRSKWMSLNGMWNYAIHSELLKNPPIDQGEILVPYPIESALSGIKKKVGPKEKLWYKRTFSVPNEWDFKEVAIHFEAVDWDTEIWLNGKYLGRHKGGYDHFKLNIGKSDLKKINELIVSVSDPTDDGWQALGKQVRNPSGIFYTSVTGIWQSVWLEPLNKIYIKQYKVTTDIINEQVIINPNLNRDNNNINLKTSVYFKDELIGESTTIGSNTININIPKASLWTPKNPNLYDLKIELFEKNKKMDHVEGYFGMRTVKIDKAKDGFMRLFLNNETVFHNGPLDQGYWPDGLYTPPSEEAMLYDLQVIKDMGFNMLRKHVKIESRRFYYLCDSIGLMVWQDMPNGDRKIGPQEEDIVRTLESANQFEFELTKLIEDHYNHPSIVMWVPFNEGWGQYDTKRIANYVKDLDPTRIVNSVSGWADRGVGDVIDLHHYPNPIAPKSEEKRVAVLGEFGGLGLPIKSHMWEAKNWGYANLNTTDQLLNRYENYYTSIWNLKEQEGLSASIYTQITDVESETNGLMTYDRSVVKVKSSEINSINSNDYIPVPVLDPKEGKIHVDEKIKVADSKYSVYYTLDGTEPTRSSCKYDGGISMGSAKELKVKSFGKNRSSRTVTRKFNSVRTPKPIYKYPFSDKYPGGGSYALINGLKGKEKFNDGNWQGFEGKDLNVILDLGVLQKVKSVSLRTLEYQDQWIFSPEQVQILVSINGKDFSLLEKFENKIEPSGKENDIKNYTFQIDKIVRYVKIVAKSIKTCPEWHLGAGAESWIFVDEIMVKSS